MGRPKTRIKKQCEKCGTPYEVVPSLASGSRFCSIICRNAAGADACRKPPRLCPCGNPIEGKRRNSALYCSPECRERHGKKRQRDPKNYVTFDCETCGKKVTRYKKYGNGANRFCTNECAAKHTRKVRHIGIRDADVVLDSGWEALVWGWATFFKLPISRVDRSLAVAVKDGWYAPDFLIEGRWVEVKGHDKPDGPERRELWEAVYGPVEVWDRDRLAALVNR